MRFTPLLGTKAWFGPRRFGWGWDPVSWEGWVTSAVYAVVIVAIVSVAPGGPGIIGVLVATAAFIGVAVSKGTAPGGAEAAERFRTWRDGQGRTPEQAERARRLRRDVPDEPSMADAAARLKRFRIRRPGAS